MGSYMQQKGTQVLQMGRVLSVPAPTRPDPPAGGDTRPRGLAPQLLPEQCVDIWPRPMQEAGAWPPLTLPNSASVSKARLLPLPSAQGARKPRPAPGSVRGRGTLT